MTDRAIAWLGGRSGRERGLLVEPGDLPPGRAIRRGRGEDHHVRAAVLDRLQHIARARDVRFVHPSLVAT